ncbi:MAG: hypothetical protein A2Y07_07365 [Planctomycetes bacterium GWF2_50_10]|nr:MAG: hypothetical protein A2Y07_07365 [Planctomycetes bacterium GWF2_50_10]
MNVPLELVFRGVERTEGVENLINERVRKLHRICKYINSVRVAVEKPQTHQEIGNPFRIRVEMRVPPGHDLVVRRESSEGDMHDPLGMMIRLAFDAGERQLRKLVGKQRYDTKNHIDPWSVGTVVKLFGKEDYGFIKAMAGDRDIYFHKHSVLNGAFEKLVVGTVVRFFEESGDEGPQASTVHILEKAPMAQIEISARSAG